MNVCACEYGVCEYDVCVCVCEYDVRVCPYIDWLEEVAWSQTGPSRSMLH